MRVILDARTATDHFPGIGRYVADLARALAQTAEGVELILLAGPTAPEARVLLPPGIPQAVCPVSPFALAQQWRVPAALAGLRPDVYHSAYYMMPYRPGVPSVLTCYDLIPLAYPEYFGAAQRLAFRLLHGLALRTARATLAISEATRGDLARYFRLDPARIHVTPLAAGPQFRPLSKEPIAAVREKYVLPERFFLYFGSNKPHKNLARLLEAWERVAGEGQALLVLAGAWDERYPEARQRVEKTGLAGTVRFLGPVPEADLPALYNAADWFVFPSLYEGFGLPVLEALSCGTPVICSNRSSLPEVAGDAALLVDPSDVAALAGALAAAALAGGRLREALAERGLGRAAHFSWERTAEATLAVYRML